MWRFIARRLLWAGFLFLVVTFLTYVIFFVVPADPAKLAAGKLANAEQVKQVAAYLNLDEPVWKQYLLWLKQLVFEGSLGRSFVNRQDVNEVIAASAPVTASLVLGGAILWLLISIPIGVLSALRPRSLLDRGAMVFVLVGISAHPVWIGLILAYVFGYKLGWTPITGYCDFFNPSPGSTCGGPAQWAYHMILPWATFSLLFAALYVRLIRANVMETMGEDYVRTARAKGAPSGQVMRSHILRNSMLPVVTILGMDIALALGGAIFTESIFSLNGLGRSVVLAYERSDLPVIVGVVVFSTVVIIIFNLIVDILYAVIDPRIRLT
jgi:peptide/nickel transport system permease protein